MWEVSLSSYRISEISVTLLYTPLGLPHGGCPAGWSPSGSALHILSDRNHRVRINERSMTRRFLLGTATRAVGIVAGGIPLIGEQFHIANLVGLQAGVIESGRSSGPKPMGSRTLKDESL